MKKGEKSMFEGQRLGDDNIFKYAGTNAIKRQYHIPNIIPLLQKDYGETNDCAITSITTVVLYYNKKLTASAIYNIVEKIGKKTRLYNSNLYGTLPFGVKKIYNDALKYFKTPKVIKEGYGKNVGYKYEQIVKHINQNKPIILNIFRDGRKYYNNHTILIVGYMEMQNGKQFLKVYDNWYNAISYVDYQKLSTISSVEFIG